ncbi:hypothetical protein ACIGBL_33255 [Streptomyces sp. NPDC085614]|uniref:hypothetical protein n=1 Tax=Streptomyces sp. NPDC085614 TaxID=3365733 RepID=UPI0037D0FDE6
MAETTDRKATRKGAPRISGPCSLNECGHCQPGDVVTSFGDVALTIRCDHSCHRGRRR